MKMKKSLSAILALALMGSAMPMAPQAAEAAVITSVDEIQPGDTRVTFKYTDASENDTYEARVKYADGTKDYVNAGTFGDKASDKSMFLFLSFNETKAVQTGDVVELSVSHNGQVTTTTKTVGEAKDPVAPTSFAATSNKITAGASASVTFKFDTNYVPHENDQILVRRFKADGTEITPSYYAALPNTISNASATIVLTDSNTENLSYYTFQFVPGDTATSSSLATVRVDVAQGSTNPSEGNGTLTPEQEEQINNATALVFGYNSENISLGESVTPVIQLTDKSGANKDYTGPVTFSYSGEAVVEDSFDTNGRFTVASDQKYIGTQIQVTAMVGSFSQTVTLTVQASDKSLLLTPATAGKGKSRAVSFQLANGAGNRLRLLWQPTMAKVVMKDKTTGAAKLAGSVTDLSAITKTGAGKLLISSDTACTAAVTIIFSDNEGHFYETAPGDFIFTDEEDEAISVQLNINSTSYTVNGVTKTTDTTPVISNNRTFIPFRLIAETLGGDVEYNYDAQTVTTTYNGTTIVMKLGSMNYTVGGVNYTMDVAPYVNSDNRTMVPLRVLAETFGCTVTPKYAADGTTASVVFEK